MSDITRRQPGSLLNLVDWLEGWPMTTPWSASVLPQMRIEELVRDGRFVVRAELPGIDPEKDVDITVADGVLTITAERREEVAEKHRSEFRYGSHVRRVLLPKGVHDDEVEATYDDGILTVSVPLPAPAAEPRSVPVGRRSEG